MNTTAIKVFENAKLGKVRVVMIDNEPWWVLADVCKVLGMSNPTVVAGRLDTDERAKFDLGCQGEATIINESGLYSVILRSDKPQAKPFRKWVTHDVLPTIRKTGGYVANGKEIDFMNNPESMLYPHIAALSKSIESLQSQIKKLQNTSQQSDCWLWKKHIAIPAISNLSEELNIDMCAAYDFIYDQMFVTYGFDRSFAMSQFCTKYCVDNTSVIDCIADSPIYQQYFLSTIFKIKIKLENQKFIDACSKMISETD